MPKRKKLTKVPLIQAAFFCAEERRLTGPPEVVDWLGVQQEFEMPAKGAFRLPRCLVLRFVAGLEKDSPEDFEVIVGLVGKGEGLDLERRRHRVAMKGLSTYSLTISMGGATLPRPGTYAYLVTNGLGQALALVPIFLRPHGELPRGRPS